MSRIFETQNQMIMRFPEEIAEKLHAYFDNPDTADCPELEIEVDSGRQKDVDPRIGLKVSVDKETYKATVMELPTVSSTFKTVDRINFFKSNDISEIVVVHDRFEDEENIREDEAQKVINKETGKVQRFECESGLTQPTRFIRQNNFKKRPDVTRSKVAEVDSEMEKIRSENAPQNKNDDKSSTGGKKRKL